MAQNQVTHLSDPTGSSQRPSAAGKADPRFTEQNIGCPKGRDQGHTNRNVTESRLKSLFSKYPSGGYFPSRLCDHPAYYTPRQEGPPSWARTREKRRGNCQRFPALADTQAPRVAARLQPSSTLAAAPAATRN